MGEPSASDFTRVSTAMLDAGAGAAHGYLAGRGIVLDEEACAMLGMLVIQAALRAWTDADREMPEPALEVQRAKAAFSHDFNEHGICQCGETMENAMEHPGAVLCPSGRS